MSKDVFISYSTENRPLAEKVCALLEQKGVTCWIAPRDIAPGAVFNEAIVDAICGTKAMVLILSSRANESPYVRNEVNLAFSRGKTIFVFRSENVLPGKSLQLFLATHHWTDGFRAPLEEQVARLSGAILSLLGTRASPPFASPDAQESEPSRVPPMEAGNATGGRISRRWLQVMVVACLAGLLTTAAIWLALPEEAGQPENRDEESEIALSGGIPVSDKTDPCAVPKKAMPAIWENSLGMKLILVHPGGFRMGSPDSDTDAADSEKPQHLVRITRPFYIGAYEVTQRQYGELMGANPSYHTQSIAGMPTENYPRRKPDVERCRRVLPQTERTRGEDLPPPNRSRVGICLPGRGDHQVSQWRPSRGSTAHRRHRRREGEPRASDGCRLLGAERLRPLRHSRQCP